VLGYDPEPTLASSLDPRTKLALQVGFAVAAFEHTTPLGLALLTPLALAALAAAGLTPLRALWAYRYALALLAAVDLGPPWIDPAAALPTALASYRVLLLLFVAAAYVRSTPARESRAAIQRLLPGRVGTLAGVGVGLVFRLFPTLLADLRRVRAASRARLGERRRLHERMRIVAVGGLARALTRADRLGAALSARCFAWNPTLPPLSLRRRDAVGLALAAALFAAGAAGWVGVDVGSLLPIGDRALVWFG